MPSDFGDCLVAQARAFIAARLELPERGCGGHFEALDAPGACFVTLKRRGQLRGCIGTLEAHRSLIDDLRHNALAAAFSDPRFPPLSAGEWPDIAVSVSLLGPIARQPVASEEEALRLIATREGVVLESGARQATFLPQVWLSLPQATEFLSALKTKAGLLGPWPSNAVIGRYEVQEFTEGGRP